jgi:hypothetical protein
MENLTRNNYEIWFLDYLDDQLSNDQLDTFLDFLELNPDLKEELRGVSEISLKAGDETVDIREILLKTPDDIPGISAIDQLCIARMENDLTPEEAEKFDARLTEDARLEKNYTAFRLTRLDPADKVIYPFKKDLIKKTRTLTPWIITAVSAAAILVFALLVWPTEEESAAGSQQLAATSMPAKEVVIPAQAKPEAGTPSLTTESAKSTSTREAMPMNRLTHRTSIIGPKIPEPQSTKLLYASNYQPVIKIPAASENILTLPQYALQLFREKILGEDRQLVRKTRFSMWEVAGAGVNGINSLAGTKMKLDREYDTDGTILAVSFNSKLVDVESPIRGLSGR